MVILFEFIGMVMIFLLISYGGYWLTEVRGLPRWLEYKPFNCRICLTFWSLIGCYLAIGLSFSCLYLMIGGIILAILNAIAMLVNQKNKTIKIEEYGLDK